MQPCAHGKAANTNNIPMHWVFRILIRGDRGVESIWGKGQEKERENENAVSREWYEHVP